MEDVWFGSACRHEKEFGFANPCRMAGAGREMCSPHTSERPKGCSGVGQANREVATRQRLQVYSLPREELQVAMKRAPVSPR